MEVRARFVLIGLFALLVVLGGFAFVYWLETGGGLGKRIVYHVRFDGPVSGLMKGSGVLFNGVRVGEVASLAFDPASPSDVVAEVSIDATAPVKADTAVTIDFQGLAGAPVIAFVGGSSAAQSLSSSPLQSRVLVAEKNAGQSLTQAGRDVLRHLDTVVGENKDSLRNAIASIDKFSAALARNSDKVDGIVSGLERLTGGGAKAIVRIIDLPAVQSFPTLAAIPYVQLLVPEPTALANFESEKVLLSGGDKTSLENVQWPDLLPRVVQARIVQSFENAGYTRVLWGTPEGKRADNVLMVDVRRFEIEDGAEPHARVELAARLVDSSGAVIRMKTFTATAAAPGLEAQVATKAFDQAFKTVAADLVLWTLSAL